MVSPARLVQAISEVTGVAHPTIVDVDRRLAKGGLRSIGGRGLNAAQMTAIDAARLLTAVLGSPQANASVDAVQRYQTTKPDKRRSSEKLFDAMGLKELITLPRQHSFVDALAALIGSAASGDLATLMAKDGCSPVLEVFAFTRATRGRIRIAGLPNQVVASVEYESAASSRLGKGRAILSAEIGDLEQSRRISERTLLPLAELLAKEEIL